MDFDIYTTEMHKSILDKAFFMDKIPGAKCVIDFGCADATLICTLGRLFPTIDFYGYDINPALLERGVEKLSQAPANVNALYDRAGLNGLIERVKRTYKPEEICINFSSVLHEVFSKTVEGERVIRHMIHELKPKFITIRDMYFEGENKVLSYYYIKEIIEAFDVDEGFIETFEDEFSSICSTKYLHHFLMKYQWRENGWDEEMEEDYFSWNIKDFINMVGQYSIIFENHYMLPYYREQWHKHGMYPVEANTHAQFILRRWD